MYGVMYGAECSVWDVCCGIFFFQAEDGIRDLVRSRGLGDVYKRQTWDGLEKLPLLKSLADRVSLDHSYSSTYTEGWKLLSLIHI